MTISTTKLGGVLLITPEKYEDNRGFFSEVFREDHSSLLEAANYVAAIERRQGLLIGSPEVCAYRQGFISRDKLEQHADYLKKNNYGIRLKQQ